MQVHLLSFEGPDPYAQAGGIASRITGLARGLAYHGADTHLWFIGDPKLPAEQSQRRITLHRWCQWISRYHPAGVYDGEEGKANDYAASLPPYLFERFLAPLRRQPEARAAVLAEEWHTVHAVLHLDWLVRRAGLRDRVRILWNANNTFGFERIDWSRLAQAATITAVSRYMRYCMRELGIDPIVIPNGLPPEAFAPSNRKALVAFRALTRERVVLTKVARWDPDKRWLLAMDTVRELKGEGLRPLLIARGGLEAHGTEVLGYAGALNLRVVDRELPDQGAPGILDAVQDADQVDVVNLRTPLAAAPRHLLFEASSAVLANSGREPFGLVGLETMAAGGVACTGGTGEDYVVPGWNALVLQTVDPGEFVMQYHRLRTHPAEERAIRRRGRITAARYAWSKVVEQHLLPRLHVRMSRRPAGRQRAAKAGRQGTRLSVVGRL